MVKLLRFRDLKDRGVVDSWAQLRRLIDHCEFPTGRMLSPISAPGTNKKSMTGTRRGRSRGRSRAARRNATARARLIAAPPRPPPKRENAPASNRGVAFSTERALGATGSQETNHKPSSAPPSSSFREAKLRQAQ